LVGVELLGMMGFSRLREKEKLFRTGEQE